MRDRKSNFPLKNHSDHAADTYPRMLGQINRNQRLKENWLLLRKNPDAKLLSEPEKETPEIITAKGPPANL